MSRDAGLEGERDTHLVVFTSFISGGMVLMYGLSRAGKDAVVDAAAYCAPGDWVFKVPGSASKTVLYQKHKRMNSAHVHRYPDLVSLEDHIERILKAHGEGKSTSHSFTDVFGERDDVTQTLHPPDCFVVFVASDNEKIDLNDYPELRNRALVVSVDASEELTKQVNSRQARDEALLTERRVSEKRTQEIRDYVGSIPTRIYATDNAVGRMASPVAVALDNQNPLPQKFTEARHDFKRLMDFMRSVALFHYRDRMEETIDGIPTLLVTPADAWYAMRIFGEKMVLSALNLRDQDLAVLDLLRNESDTGRSADEIQMELKHRGLNITDRDVNRALSNMKTKGYVRKDQTQSPVLWSPTPFAFEVSHDINIDWSQIVQETKFTAREALPGGIADDYISNYCQGEGLIVTHPFTGETLNITEFKDELEEKVEAQAQKEDEIANSRYRRDDDDGNDEPEVAETGLGAFTGRVSS